MWSLFPSIGAGMPERRIDRVTRASTASTETRGRECDFPPDLQWRGTVWIDVDQAAEQGGRPGGAAAEARLHDPRAQAPSRLHPWLNATLGRVRSLSSLPAGAAEIPLPRTARRRGTRISTRAAERSSRSSIAAWLRAGYPHPAEACRGTEAGRAR